MIGNPITQFCSILERLSKSAQYMLPPLTAAVERPVKYFARIENQQNWRKNVKTIMRKAVMANGICSFLKYCTVASMSKVCKVSSTGSKTQLEEQILM